MNLMEDLALERHIAPRQTCLSDRFLSHTQRSLLAEMKLRAHLYNSPLQTMLVGPPAEPGGTIHICERRVGGWRTGIYDGAVLLSAAASSAHIRPWLASLAPTLADADAVTLRIIGPGMPTQALISSQENRRVVEVTGQPFKIREVMPLADTFESFLRGLGKHTRRNMVHAQSRAHRDGIKFCFTTAESSVDRSRLLTVAKLNIPFPTKPRQLLSTIQFLAAQPRPFQAHLSQLADHPFSIAGGFIEGDLALMNYQINNRIFRNLSPSLMLRSFLVQALIERGVRYLAFVGGCAGPLYHQCTVVPAAEVLMMRRTSVARAKHFACRMIGNPKDRFRRLTPQFITVLCAVGYPLMAFLGSAFT
jgi:hypothetical protein